MANKSVHWLTPPKRTFDPKEPSYYGERNALLRKLFGQTYTEYLESKLWKAIRKVVLEKAKYGCVLCLKPATQVHHTHYTQANLLGEKTTGMVAICADCHKAIEFDAAGQKVPPHVTKILFAERMERLTKGRDAEKREHSKRHKRRRKQRQAGGPTAERYVRPKKRRELEKKANRLAINRAKQAPGPYSLEAAKQFAATRTDRE